MKKTPKTPVTPLTLTLSPEATRAVYNFRSLAGREPEDIVNGALVGWLRQVSENLAEPELHQDCSPKMMDEYAIDAWELRIKRQGSPALLAVANRHTITIELSEVAYAMLVILADHDGYPTLKDALLGAAAVEIRSLFGQVYGSDDSKIEETLGVVKPDTKEEA